MITGIGIPKIHSSKPLPMVRLPALGLRNAAKRQASERRSRALSEEISRCSITVFSLHLPIVNERAHRQFRSAIAGQKWRASDPQRQEPTPAGQRSIGRSKIARSVYGNSPVQGAKRNGRSRHARVQTWGTRN